ncbi:ribosome biogenesis GTPase Der [Thermodesulfobacteriota bacterium]
MTSIVAIVGRPNVGKSTLFNRLSRSKDSLVDDHPGVTRDRLYTSVRWGETPFTIIDTGGFDDHGKETLLSQVREQVIRAIEEADLIIFMMDGHEGLIPGDEDINTILRRFEKRVFTVVNKVDGPEQEHLTHDFYRLGVDKVYPISAAHGYGLKALMEDITVELPKQRPPEAKDIGPVRVAVLGRPNAGKSSLINRILGFDRLLVSELPGTTRDSIDILFKWKGKEYLLIDTAGIRRKSRVKERIEKFSMIKALRSLDRCHVAIILLDAGAGIAEQDARICGYALDRGRGLVLAVNKWDLIRKEPDKKRDLNGAIERQLRFTSFAPRINLSALTGERVKKIFEKIDLVYGQFCVRVSTGAVNRAVEEMIQKRPPPRIGQGRLKFLYATQAGIKPPTFVVFVNRPKMVHFSYKRFMINQLREQFSLNHTPIRLIFRKRKRD